MPSREELLALLPRKDAAAAEHLVRLGYPAVAPILPELLACLQDANWPEAPVLAPFLASIGLPLVPRLRQVLNGTDDIWKYWCLVCLLRHWPAEWLEPLKPELERLASRPTSNERAEGVDVEASEILARLAAARA